MTKLYCNQNANTNYCSNCAVKEFCLPVGLPDNNLNKLDKLVKSKTIFHKDDVLFEVEEPLNNLFVIRSGSFKTYKVNSSGEERILGFHFPGEILGFDALAQDKHTVYAKALETSSTCEITFKNLFLLAADIPSLQRRLLTLVSQQDYHNAYMFDPQSSALGRVCSLLANFSDRFKNRGLSPTQFSLSMSRQDIASHLGLTNETTSRTFSKLVKEKIIALQNRQVEILDLVKLHQAIAD